MLMYYDWDEEKNNILKSKRDISFEQIIIEINSGNLLDVLENPNQDKFSHQFMYVVKSGEYVYCVPFVQDEEKIFLKTIYPSRKFKKLYEQK